MLITTSRREEVFVRSLPPLHQILYRGLPLHRRAMKKNKTFALNVSRLAEDLKITPQAIYVWLDTDSLPATWVIKLQRVNGSTLTYEHLETFARIS